MTHFDAPSTLLNDVRGAQPRTSPACFSYRFCVTFFPSVVREEDQSVVLCHRNVSPTLARGGSGANGAPTLGPAHAIHPAEAECDPVMFGRRHRGRIGLGDATTRVVVHLSLVVRSTPGGPGLVRRQRPCMPAPPQSQDQSERRGMPGPERARSRPRLGFRVSAAAGVAGVGRPGRAERDPSHGPMARSRMERRCR